MREIVTYHKNAHADPHATALESDAPVPPSGAAVAERTLFLLRAAGRLLSSLDRTALAARAAKLGVPTLGDTCLVDLVDERGRLQRAASARVDPVTGRRILGVRGVVERQRALRVVPTRGPCLTVPLRNRGTTLGAMTFERADPSRVHTREERATARRLARLVAKALGNARVHREAQSAIAARDDLLAAVSHDLRTPLARLYLVTSELEHVVARQHRHWVDVVRSSAGYMTRIVDDLLDLRRLEAHGVVLDRSRQELGPILHEAMAMAVPRAGARMVLELAADLPPVAVDRHRLVQALSNLLENAARSRALGLEIVVRAELRRDEVWLSVRDNGRGIATTDLPHVFDRYWQAKSSDGRGLGMGLAIARSIAEAHGGRIWVESELGVGTTLAISLPLDAPRAASRGPVPGLATSRPSAAVSP